MTEKELRDIIKSQLKDIMNEGTFSNSRVIAMYYSPNNPEEGETEIEKRGSKYYGNNQKFDFEAKNKKELLKKLKDWGMELVAGSLDEGRPFFQDTPNEFAYLDLK